MSDKQYLSADDFLGGILGQPVDHEVAGLGTVQVRSLTFTEVRDLSRKHKGDEVSLTLAIISTGLVQPVLSADQAAQLGQARPGVIAELSQHIMEISGMVDLLPEAQADDLGNAAGGGS